MNMSRRPGRSPRGKRIVELRSMTDTITKADFEAKANELGLSPSDAVELACQVWTYGSEHVVSLHIARIEDACEIG